MLSTDFAPNEYSDDALESLITLITPWRWNRGEETNHVKKRLLHIFHGDFCHLFLSGRTTLHVLLESLHLNAGEEIIVQGFTCGAVVLPIIDLSLKPVYCDIETDTFSSDFDDLQRKITPKTKVIILQHSFGILPKDRDRVLQLAKDKKIFLIEDLAHGFSLNDWQNQSLSANQVLLCSFGRSKAFSSVFGGGLIHTNKALAEQINLISSRFSYPKRITAIKLLLYKPFSLLIKKTYNFFHLGSLFHYVLKHTGLLIAEISKKERGGKYDEYLEYNYPNSLAILLLHQLKKAESFQTQRALISSLYMRQLASRHSPVASRQSPIYSRFPFLVKNKQKILERLRKHSIYLGNWYSQPIAPNGLDLKKVGYTKGMCPTAETVCESIINLPTLITEDQAKTIINIIHDTSFD